MAALPALRDAAARHLRLDGSPFAQGPYAIVGLGLLGFCLAAVGMVLTSGNRFPSSLPSAWSVLCCTGFVLLLVLDGFGLWGRAALAVLVSVAAAVLPAPAAAASWAVAVAVVAGGGASRVLVTGAGLALGGAWFAGAVALLPAHRAHGLELARPHLLATPGVFLALGLELVRVRLIRDVLASELAGVPLVGRQAAERWARLLRALERFPRSTERERLWAQGREAAERVAERGRRFEEATRLVQGLDAEAARAELEALRQHIEAEADAATRALLTRAAQVQSDALEQVEGFTRQTRRLEASLRAAQSVLERVVTHVELTPTHPRELSSASIRVAKLLEAEAAT